MFLLEPYFMHISFYSLEVDARRDHNNSLVSNLRQWYSYLPEAFEIRVLVMTISLEVFGKPYNLGDILAYGNPTDGKVRRFCSILFSKGQDI